MTDVNRKLQLNSRLWNLFNESLVVGGGVTPHPARAQADDAERDNRRKLSMTYHQASHA